MTKKLTTIATAIAFTCFLGSNASALTINDTGVVGSVDGLAGDNANEEVAFAEHLLAMASPDTDDFVDALSGVSHHYETGDNPYAAADLTELNSSTGAEWAMVKYDGQNAGYVLFNLADWGSDPLPQFSSTIWGTGDQYAASHTTYFDSNGTPVPDGGATAAMLGSALLGFGLLRRKFWRS